MTKLNPKDYEKMGRMIEEIYYSGSANMKRLMWYNFMKGIAYGFGIFIAGTVVVAFMIWFLGLFDQAPLIGPFVQKLLDSLTF
jgi:hypothetical protein